MKPDWGRQSLENHKAKTPPFLTAQNTPDVAQPELQQR
jgi:hypothetical protein